MPGPQSTANPLLDKREKEEEREREKPSPPTSIASCAGYIANKPPSWSFRLLSLILSPSHFLHLPHFTCVYTIYRSSSREISRFWGYVLVTGFYRSLCFCFSRLGIHASQSLSLSPFLSITHSCTNAKFRSLALSDSSLYDATLRLLLAFSFTFSYPRPTFNGCRPSCANNIH